MHFYPGYQILVTKIYNMTVFCNGPNAIELNLAAHVVVSRKIGQILAIFLMFSL